MATNLITSQQVGAYYDQLAQYYRLAWGDNLHMGIGCRMIRMRR
ncbi:MAG: hypothetical protein WA821_05395 [Anaerolineales bacterium]